MSNTHHRQEYRSMGNVVVLDQAKATPLTSGSSRAWLREMYRHGDGNEFAVTGELDLVFGQKFHLRVAPAVVNFVRDFGYIVVQQNGSRSLHRGRSLRLQVDETGSIFITHEQIHKYPATGVSSS